MTVIINGTTGISGVDGSAGTPAVQGSDTNTGVFYPAADTVGVSTGGSERMRVDSSGNVGIGSSTVIGKMQVNVGDITPTSTSANMNGFVISNGNGGNGLSLGTADTGGYNWISSGYVNSAASGRPLAIFTAGTERMRIDSSGNVGIGCPHASSSCSCWRCVSGRNYAAGPTSTHVITSNEATKVNALDVPLVTPID